METSSWKAMFLKLLLNEINFIHPCIHPFYMSLPILEATSTGLGITWYRVAPPRRAHSPLAPTDNTSSPQNVSGLCGRSGAPRRNPTKTLGKHGTAVLPLNELYHVAQSARRCLWKSPFSSHIKRHHTNDAQVSAWVRMWSMCSCATSFTSSASIAFLSHTVAEGNSLSHEISHWHGLNQCVTASMSAGTGRQLLGCWEDLCEMEAGGYLQGLGEVRWQAPHQPWRWWRTANVLRGGKGEFLH